MNIMKELLSRMIPVINFSFIISVYSSYKSIYYWGYTTIWLAINIIIIIILLSVIVDNYVTKVFKELKRILAKLSNK